MGGAKGEGEFEGSGRGFKMTSSTRRRAEPRGEGELEGSGRGFKMTSSTRQEAGPRGEGVHHLHTRGGPG